MANERIKEAAKERGVFLWQIAERVGVNDGNFSRRLRRELPKHEQARILQIIDEIAEEADEA